VKLELGNIFIKDVIFSNETKVVDGVLHVNKEAIIEALMQDPRLAKVDIDLAKPGEEVRIIPVKDVIEPRVKVEDRVACSRIHQQSKHGWQWAHTCTEEHRCGYHGTIVGFQEGIIDMSGEGAKYTPFSKTLNIVVVCEPVEGLPKHEHEEVVRLAGLRAAALIGEAGRNVEPDEIKVYETLPLFESVKKYPDLPEWDTCISCRAKVCSMIPMCTVWMRRRFCPHLCIHRTHGRCHCKR